MILVLRPHLKLAVCPARPSNISTIKPHVSAAEVHAQTKSLRSFLPETGLLRLRIASFSAHMRNADQPNKIKLPLCYTTPPIPETRK